jgi:hypothetical protein
MYMLYQALHDYLKGQEELVSSLKKVLDFVFPGTAIQKKD